MLNDISGAGEVAYPRLMVVEVPWGAVRLPTVLYVQFAGNNLVHNVD